MVSARLNINFEVNRLQSYRELEIVMRNQFLYFLFSPQII